MPVAKRVPKKQTRKASPVPAGGAVACWEDDPGDPKQRPPLSPINVPVPNQAATPLPFKISGKAPTPRVYSPGTKEFLYYAAACALRRTADFWGGFVPRGTKWQIGAT